MWVRARAIAAVLVFAAAAVTTGSCGGGSSGGAPAPPPTTGSGGGGGGGSGGGASGGGACASLMANPDAGRVLRFDGTLCWRATSHPNGQIALGMLVPTPAARWLLFPPDGSAQRGEIPSFPVSLTVGILDIDPFFHPTSTGWAALVHDPPPPMALRSFDGAGSVLATSSDSAVSSAPDGHGGTVMLGRSFTLGGSSPSYGPTMLEWLDASGRVLRTATLDADPTLLLVNWGTDHVLTLIPGADGLRARWYDDAGTALTPWFDAGTAIHSASIHLMVDGTIALSDDQTWRGVFHDGVARIDPPPDWLATRPGTRLATIRSGAGYAVLPHPLVAPDTVVRTRFEIVTASGDSCGTVSIPAPPDEPGVTHAPQALDVGNDGTLFQAELLTGSGLGLGKCEFRWWPALLK